jgi:hypothetical protein
MTLALVLTCFSEIAIAGKSGKKSAQQIIPQTTQPIVEVGISIPQVNQAPKPPPNETATTLPSSNSSNSSNAVDLKGQADAAPSTVSKLEEETNSASVENESAEFDGQDFLDLQDSTESKPNGGLQLVTSAMSWITIALSLLY